VKRLAVGLLGVAVLVGAASARGDARELTAVVRDLQVRVIDPVASVETIPGTDGVGLRLPGDVLFAFDEDQLGAPGLRAVSAAAHILAGQHARRLAVEGHTDARGKAAYNLRLARRRATTVAEALRSELPGVRIAVRAYGEARPVASNTTAPGRARNRRVEIRAAD
jgi:outer membrane protein OmpA-like peptidoglycan-associated protein